MRPNPQDVEVLNPAELRDKALNLRESVNSSRARMSGNAERIERLRREIAELRALIENSPAAAAYPDSRPRLRSAPIIMEAASDSTPKALPVKTRARFDSWKPVPYIAIFFVAVGMQLHASRTAAPVAASALAEAPSAALLSSPESSFDEDGGAGEALLLAHEWRLPGDERPLSERLGSDTNPPGTQPDWTAERTGERMYRVSFRPSRSETSYDFDVDLVARRVDPTPETEELISPHLASRR